MQKISTFPYICRMKLLCLFFLSIVILSCSNNNESVYISDTSDKYEIVQDSIFRTFNGNKEISSIVFSSVPQKVIVLATPLYSYIRALNVERNVVGMLSLERLSGIPTSIKSLGKNNEIDLEKIIELSPDLIICNSFQLKSISILKTKYQILVIDEYLENNPLRKASWIVFFGALFHKKTESNNIYSKIKRNYTSFPSEGIKVIQLNNYGGKWYLPGCKSYISQVIRDAGGEVDCDSEKVGSDVISEESAMVKLNKLDYLLFFDFAQDTSGLKIRLKPVLDLVKSNKLKVLYCSTIKTNFFNESILNPDVVLNGLNSLITQGIDGEFFKLIILEN